MEKELKHKRRNKFTWRAWHKWVGLVFSVFIILFCLSGIVLNHRKAFSPCEVSRWWLPAQYHLDNWNQGVIKGTVQVQSAKFKVQSEDTSKVQSEDTSKVQSEDTSKVQRDAIITYGQVGVWLTDRGFKHWMPLNDGIDEGIDNHKISNVVKTGDGTLWCAALFDAYRLNSRTLKWEKVSLPGNEERLSDITLKGRDTIVVASRSFLYIAVSPQYKFRRIQLKAPAVYKPEVTLFKTVWMLHSGELFGTVGKLVVDFIGIVILILCITGIVFFVCRAFLREKPKVQWRSKVMKVSLRWHNRFGASMIILTLFLAVTGMCLRPPLMVPLVLNKTAPVPGSTMDTDNAFQDKIRAIRWDDRLGVWLMSTSEGFFQMQSAKCKVQGEDSLRVAEQEISVPVKMGNTPVVSPMGITVFQRNPYNNSEWLIGSFAGLERWNPQTGMVAEWFDDAPEPSYIPSTDAHNVTGFSADLDCSPTVFEYYNAPTVDKGTMPAMPEVLKNQPMSLWNFALELHVGRCYEPFLGSIVSILFVFISGLLLTLILISGYIVYRKGRRRKRP